ncbi:hypothetical protein HK100_003556 [Physocladia obscura]|uniref:Uncharacterized protein n=1 Tax=Physocladia obscura TaxID=109957 RepID=A0AAD5TA24_9FUNG|nr:hypothetical protein HK100_003556 [Physocladia obscura]
MSDDTTTTTATTKTEGTGKITEASTAAPGSRRSAPHDQTITESTKKEPMSQAQADTSSPSPPQSPIATSTSDPDPNFATTATTTVGYVDGNNASNIGSWTDGNTETVAIAAANVTANTFDAIIDYFPLITPTFDAKLTLARSRSLSHAATLTQSLSLSHAASQSTLPPISPSSKSPSNISKINEKIESENNTNINSNSESNTADAPYSNILSRIRDHIYTSATSSPPPIFSSSIQQVQQQPSLPPSPITAITTYTISSNPLLSFAIASLDSVYGIDLVYRFSIAALRFLFAYLLILARIEDEEDSVWGTNTSSAGILRWFRMESVAIGYWRLWCWWSHASAAATILVDSPSPPSTISDRFAVAVAGFGGSTDRTRLALKVFRLFAVLSRARCLLRVIIGAKCALETYTAAKASTNGGFNPGGNNFKSGKYAADTIHRPSNSSKQESRAHSHSSSVIRHFSSTSVQKQGISRSASSGFAAGGVGGNLIESTSRAASSPGNLPNEAVTSDEDNNKGFVDGGTKNSDGSSILESQYNRGRPSRKSSCGDVSGDDGEADNEYSAIAVTKNRALKEPKRSKSVGRSGGASVVSGDVAVTGEELTATARDRKSVSRIRPVNSSASSNIRRKKCSSVVSGDEGQALDPIPLGFEKNRNGNMLDLSGSIENGQVASLHRIERINTAPVGVPLSNISGQPQFRQYQTTMYESSNSFGGATQNFITKSLSRMPHSDSVASFASSLVAQYRSTMTPKSPKSYSTTPLASFPPTAYPTTPPPPLPQQSQLATTDQRQQSSLFYRLLQNDASDKLTPVLQTWRKIIRLVHLPLQILHLLLCTRGIAWKPPVRLQSVHSVKSYSIQRTRDITRWLGIIWTLFICVDSAVTMRRIIKIVKQLGVVRGQLVLAIRNNGGGGRKSVKGDNSAIGGGGGSSSQDTATPYGVEDFLVDLVGKGVIGAFFEAMRVGNCVGAGGVFARFSPNCGGSIGVGDFFLQQQQQQQPVEVRMLFEEMAGLKSELQDAFLILLAAGGDLPQAFGSTFRSTRPSAALSRLAAIAHKSNDEALLNEIRNETNLFPTWFVGISGIAASLAAARLRWTTGVVVDSL